MMKELKTAIEKTVKFWSEKSFKTPMNQNNGDASESGGLTFFLMNMVSDKAQESVTDSGIESFENKLTELLMNCEPHNRFLDVDYNPCDMLRLAALHAGLDSACFPCKTHTRINTDNTVDASYQYRGELIKL